jgi:putative endonuclease
MTVDFMKQKIKKLRANRFGHVGEAVTVAALRLKGYRIIERGRKTGRGTGAGEVDIIARRRGMLAFVEVKSRSDRELLEVLTQQQRQRISKAAAFYLAKHPEFAHDSVRFDVVIIRPWRLPLWMRDAWRTEGF